MRDLDAPLPAAPPALLERLELGSPSWPESSPARMGQPPAGAGEAPPAPPPHDRRAVASGEQVSFPIPLYLRE
jgi:hypothetical protein